MKDEELASARALWRHRGQRRPERAVVPADGQESVWDYPRPPRLEPDPRQVVVRLERRTIADTRRAIRVLETASPPGFYLPPEDIQMELLEPAPGVASFCEWKGQARYWSVRGEGRLLERAAWSYPEPLEGFEPIRGYVAFYPRGLECTVDGERVRPQPGDFYGGWITDDVVGPFKGERGTESW